jgi:myo-inositol catabolism protein IolS
MTPTSRPRRPSTAAKRRPPAASKPPARPTAATIDELPLPGAPRPHPALGLGLWGRGRWSAEDEARTKAAIGRAYERGIRWFDTAEVYGAGRSERLLGEVLSRAVDGGRAAYLVTKVSWEHLRPAQIRASLVRSLERLARPSVDLYLVHAPDPHVPLAETMPALEALWKEGKTAALGVSNFSVEQLEEAGRHLAEAKIVVNQVRYNLLDRAEGDPLREYCRSHGILIEAYSPLARGLLADRSLDGKRLPPEARRLSSQLFDPEHRPTMVERARAVRALAEEAGVPLASIALHWLRRQGAVPVFGASRPEQVDQNLAAWAVRPRAALLERADALARGDRA